MFWQRNLCPAVVGGLLALRVKSRSAGGGGGGLLGGGGVLAWRCCGEVGPGVVDPRARGGSRADEGDQGRWIVEHSPVGSSQSNGVIERAVKSVEGQLRVVKLALE